MKKNVKKIEKKYCQKNVKSKKIRKFKKFKNSKISIM